MLVSIKLTSGNFGELTPFFKNLFDVNIQHHSLYFYGTKNKLKEFIDLCHENGIAVILDLALNHVFGRSPIVKLWMNDPDNNGWGDPSSENPYLNQSPKHTYSVGYDFNHSF